MTVDNNFLLPQGCEGANFGEDQTYQSPDCPEFKAGFTCPESFQFTPENLSYLFNAVMLSLREIEDQDIFGTNDQIPFINDTDDGFEYKDGLKFDEGDQDGLDILSATLLRTIGNGLNSQTLGNISTQSTASVLIGDGIVLGNDTNSNTIVGAQIIKETNANSATALGQGCRVATRSVSIGSSSNAELASQSVTIAPASTNTGSASVLIGDQSNNAGSNSVAIGKSSSNTSTSSTVVGHSSSSEDAYCSAFGRNSETLQRSCISIGANASSGVYSTNEAVIGGDPVTQGFPNGDGEIITLFIGRGAQSTAPDLDPTNISATNGLGTDINGRDLIIKAGSSTGAGASGTLRFDYTPSGVSSAVLNTPLEGYQLDNDGNVEILTNDRGIILRSPNGTRFLTKVNDLGQLTTTAI